VGADLSEAHLLANLKHLIPPRSAKGRRDESADVTFAEGVLIHAAPRESLRFSQKPGFHQLRCVRFVRGIRPRRIVAGRLSIRMRLPLLSGGRTGQSRVKGACPACRALN